MSSYDDLKRKLAERAAASKTSARAELEAEFVEHVFPLLEANEDHLHIEVPGSKAGLPKHVVLRPLSAPEFRRVKHVFAKDKSKPGVLEEQAKITEQLASGARVYPPKERYEALLEAHPAIAEKCSDALLSKARADEEEQGKG